MRHLAARGFWRKVDVDRFRGTPVVRFHDPELRLDLGAIAKGYAIDRATAALRARGIHDAIVTVGGDLFASGRAPGGDRGTSEFARRTTGPRSPRPSRSATARWPPRGIMSGSSSGAECGTTTSSTRKRRRPARTSVHSTTVLADSVYRRRRRGDDGVRHAAGRRSRIVRRSAAGAEVISLT